MSDSGFQRKMPSPNPAKSGNRVESAEQLRIESIKELKTLASRWRVKGDYWRADKIEWFIREFLSGPEVWVARTPK